MDTFREIQLCGVWRIVESVEKIHTFRIFGVWNAFYSPATSLSLPCFLSIFYIV